MIVNRSMATALWLAMAVVPIEATAGIVRCVTANGQVEYRESPCPDGSGREVEIRDERIGSVAPKPRHKLRRRSAKARATRRERARKKKPQVSDLGCWRKRRALEAVERRLRRGYRAGEGVRLRERRDDYEDFITRFCGDRGR